MIESHALVDMLANWEPGLGSLEPWAPSPDIPDTLTAVAGLTPVIEASGRSERWLLSEPPILNGRDCASIQRQTGYVS